MPFDAFGSFELEGSIALSDPGDFSAGVNRRLVDRVAIGVDGLYRGSDIAIRSRH